MRDMNKFKLVRRGKRFVVRVGEEERSNFNNLSVESWLKECKIAYEIKYPSNSHWYKNQNDYWYSGDTVLIDHEWDFDYYFENKSDAIAFMLRWL